MHIEDEAIQKMLHGKGNKIFTSSKRRKAKFLDDSIFLTWLASYKERTVSFEEISCRIAQQIFDVKMKVGIYEDFDLIVAEALYDERRYLVVFENSYHDGMCHHVNQEAEAVENEIIAAKTMLSMNLSKGDSAFYIELSDASVSVIEEKVDVEGEKREVYSRYILKCESGLSYTEGTKALQKTCSEIADKFDLDEVSILPKMKKIVNENVEACTDIQLDEIAQILFDGTPPAKREFIDEMKSKGFTQALDVENVKPAKAEKVQKIKTDSGIEIIIPIDYMNSRDYVEFSNAPDGTISIRLKNINKIISK